MLQLFQNSKVRRVLNFSTIGIVVMLGGALLMITLVDALKVDKSLAYGLQALGSIEANFFLNYYLTWGDRRGRFLTTWLRFHTSRVVTVVVNQILFSVLVAANVHHLIAYFGCIAIVTIVSYVVNDRFVFVRA